VVCGGRLGYLMAPRSGYGDGDSPGSGAARNGAGLPWAAIVLAESGEAARAAPARRELATLIDHRSLLPARGGCHAGPAFQWPI